MPTRPWGSTGAGWFIVLLCLIGYAVLAAMLGFNIPTGNANIPLILTLLGAFTCLGILI